MGPSDSVLGHEPRPCWATTAGAAQGRQQPQVLVACEEPQAPSWQCLPSQQLPGHDIPLSLLGPCGWPGMPRVPLPCVIALLVEPGPKELPAPSHL